MIPLVSVDVREAESLVIEVLRSGRLTQGPMVERLEAAMSGLAGTEHAIAVNSGTAALSLSLEALDLRPGDEVVTSPFTFAATLNAIIASGATARFADIRPSDFNIDPALVEDQINERTKVVLPVSLYGQMADLVAIEKLAAVHGLSVVEDSAQAIGATLNDRPAGSFGVGCFSLYATKNVTAGEGGVVTTDDSRVADRVRLSRNQGMRGRYDYACIGGNHRLSDMHAAVGLSQIRQLEEFSTRRRYNADRLSEGLAGIPGLVIPDTLEGRRHVWHQYTVRLTDDAPCTRDEFAAALAAEGIATGIYYPRLAFDYDCYREHPQVIASEAPVAARITSEILSLPVHPRLTDPELDRIVSAVRKALCA